MEPQKAREIQNAANGRYDSHPRSYIALARQIVEWVLHESSIRVGDQQQDSVG
jgi:hypothetical protein